MFEPQSTARLFGLAPGVDFPHALIDGLRQRLDGTAPEAMARVVLIVNTTRMQRRLRQLFDEGQPSLLPQIRLVTDLDDLAPEIALPPVAPALRRRLELVTLVSRLLDSAPELAPKSALYDLADSLARLMEEMAGEGVMPDAISQLDVSDLSGHWERAQQFIAIAQRYMADVDKRPDKEQRQRQLVEALSAHWVRNPPSHPVVLAGSTGSRGTTLKLMQAVAQLPQGAVVLPGFDFGQPADVWERLDDPLIYEDHPQYRFARLCQALEVPASTVQPWTNSPPPAPARNRLVSLSLRPAPVTDAWIDEGPQLDELGAATAGLTLLEAPTPRAEALAIALRLRAAAEDGQSAALISPDRTLTRQVTAALDQWDILPDDSAGSPLHLSPPGRFLRHVAALFRQPLTAESLLTLLKHPLCHANETRPEHVLRTQRLEARIRDQGLPYPDAAGLHQLMAAGGQGTAEDLDWADWVAGLLTEQLTSGSHPLAFWVERHRGLAESLSQGPDGTGSGELWAMNAGQQADAILRALAENADFGNAMPATDYADLVGALLAEGEVRDRDAPHPHIMIWGTLEARVQGADLVILAGLNEGTWPEAPAADPWLNRQLRRDAGLLLPERRIGLAAHDYQQAVAAPEVWISRAIRSDDAETVAARWVNRLQNLLGGLEDQSSPEHLAAMRARGQHWLDLVAAFETVDRAAPAPRPAPVPPVAARPRRLSVTEIQTLIRDPYAIYAKHVLGLRPVGPLVPTADALLRGTLAHEILEGFIADVQADPACLTPEHLRERAHDILGRHVPWPAARALLRARFDRLAPWFVDAERQRLTKGTPIAMEKDARAVLDLTALGITLTARADRIDATDDGRVILYDYKSGKPPSKPEQIAFNKQLLIEAAMVEQGAFKKLGPRTVAEALYVGLRAPDHVIPAPLDDEPTAQVLARLTELLAAYVDPNKGYTARLALQMDRLASDYDLLARYGEWDATDAPIPEQVG